MDDTPKIVLGKIVFPFGVFSPTSIPRIHHESVGGDGG